MMMSLSPIITLKIIIILLSVLTFSRNDIWYTKVALWNDTAEKSPMKARVHCALGLSYWLAGDLDGAFAAFTRSNALDRAHLETYDNIYKLGEVFEDQRNFFKATDCFDIICTSAPPLFMRQKRIACDRVSRFRAVIN